jgi:hypothetical protein
MNWVTGEVEDIDPPGGGVAFDRDWVVDWLEGVRELEEIFFSEGLVLGRACSTGGWSRSRLARSRGGH